MLAGYIPIRASDVNDDTGNVDTTDCTWVTALGNATAAPCNTGATSADATVAIPLACAPTCAASPAKPTGGTANGIKAEATDIAPEWYPAIAATSWAHISI